MCSAIIGSKIVLIKSIQCCNNEKLDYYRSFHLTLGHDVLQIGA